MDARAQPMKEDIISSLRGLRYRNIEGQEIGKKLRMSARVVQVVLIDEWYGSTEMTTSGM